MKEEDIKQAADNYAKTSSVDYIMRRIINKAFIAGAEANTPKWEPITSPIRPIGNEKVLLWKKDELYIIGTFWSFTGEWRDLHGDIVYPSHWTPFPSHPNTQI